MIACDWNTPGHDRYTGEVATAIAAYHLPIATQAELVRAWERREFTDTVVIDRDAIRGRTYDYDPEIRSMHFGSAGRVCDTVTRIGWSPVHVESAVVLCAAGQCIGIPAVCGNVFRLIRRDPVSGAALGPADGPVPGGIESAQGLAQDALPIEPTGSGNLEGMSTAPTWSSTGAAAGGAAYFIGGGECAPAMPVPEPQTWALLLLGLVAIVWRKRA